MNLEQLDKLPPQNWVVVVIRTGITYMRARVIPLDTLEGKKKVSHQYFMDKIQICALKPVLLRLFHWCTIKDREVKRHL